MSAYREIADMIKKCWEFECDDSCPYWDYDNGFKCTRYKFDSRLEDFLDRAVELMEKDDASKGLD